MTRASIDDELAELLAAQKWDGVGGLRREQLAVSTVSAR